MSRPGTNKIGYCGDVTDILVSPDAVADWQTGYEQRLRDWYGAAGYTEAAVETILEQGRARAGGWTVAEIAEGGARIGFVVIGMRADNGTPLGNIVDLWVHPAHVGQGHERAARMWAERWAAKQGAARISVRITEPTTLYDDYGVRGQARMRVLTEPMAPVDGVTGRPMTEAEYPAWFAVEKIGYVEGIVRAGAMSPEEARAKSDKDYAELLPQGLSTPDNSLWVLEDDGVAVGSFWRSSRRATLR